MKHVIIVIPAMAPAERPPGDLAGKHDMKKKKPCSFNHTDTADK